MILIDFFRTLGELRKQQEWRYRRDAIVMAQEVSAIAEDKKSNRHFYKTDSFSFRQPLSHFFSKVEKYLLLSTLEKH